MPRLPNPAKALLSIVTVLLAACQGGEVSTSPPRTVLVQAASQAASNAAVFTGEVRARHELELSFRVGGKLASRLVDTGAEIRNGQILARLDPADLELAAASARAQLAAAESDFANAQAERERYAGLLSRKFISQAAFDAKENARNVAQGRLEQARAQSQISRHQAEYGILSAGFSGVVAAVLAEPGQVVGAGQPIFRLARPEEKEVAIAIPESRIGELKAARDIFIDLWAAPETRLRGELRELAPVADAASRTYAARIRILNPPPEVRLGMTARVALGASAGKSLIVPLPAVIDLGKGPLVRVVQEGKVLSRPVQVERFLEDGALIAAGLNAGELVVAAGASRLVDGETVQVKPLPTPAQQR